MSNSKTSTARKKTTAPALRAQTRSSALQERLTAATDLTDAMTALMDAAERERVARAAEWNGKASGAMEQVRDAAILAVGIERACAEFANVRDAIESDLRGALTYIADYKRNRERIRERTRSMLDALASETYQPELEMIARCYKTGHYANLTKLVPGA
jgi:hypothetical protein